MRSGDLFRGLVTSAHCFWGIEWGHIRSVLYSPDIAPPFGEGEDACVADGVTLPLVAPLLRVLDNLNWVVDKEVKLADDVKDVERVEASKLKSTEEVAELVDALETKTS